MHVFLFYSLVVHKTTCMYSCFISWLCTLGREETNVEGGKRAWKREKLENKKSFLSKSSHLVYL